MNRIRDASLDDMPRLLEMAKRFHGESVYGDVMPYREDALRNLFAMMIQSTNGLVRVAVKDGEVIGMIVAMIFPNPMSMEITSTEVLWWVEPEHRGKSGLRLFEQAEQWAKDQGATKAIGVAPSLEVGNLYTRRGYAALEMHYVKDL